MTRPLFSTHPAEQSLPAATVPASRAGAEFSAVKAPIDTATADELDINAKRDQYSPQGVSPASHGIGGATGPVAETSLTSAPE